MTERRPPQPLPATLPCWHCGADVPVSVPKAICPGCGKDNCVVYGWMTPAYWLLPSRTIEGAYR